MSDFKAIVMINRSGTLKYLSGLQFFSYGEKVIAAYDNHPSTAMPIPFSYCNKLIVMLRCEFPNFGAPAIVNGVALRGIEFDIIPFPSCPQGVTGDD